MRGWDRRCLLVVCVMLAPGSAHADEPPVVVEPPLPDLPAKPPTPTPTEPSPVKIEMPPGAQPPAPAPPPSAASVPPSPSPPPSPTPAPPVPPLARRSTTTELGLGVAYLGAIQSRTTHSEVGAVFHVAPRFPIGDHYGIGVRFAYGLTGWDRTEDVARAGYKVGRWTTHAYGDVWDWAGEGEKDTRALRYFGAFFAFFGLIVPYVVAGVLYLVSPLAASSFAEADVTFNWEPADDPKQGPYLKGGIGFAAYVHPDTSRLYGGLGPNVGFGYRVDNLNLGVVGTFLPYGAHGSATAEHVLMGGFTIGLVH